MRLFEKAGFRNIERELRFVAHRYLHGFLMAGANERCRSGAVLVRCIWASVLETSVPAERGSKSIEHAQPGSAGRSAGALDRRRVRAEVFRSM